MAVLNFESSKALLLLREMHVPSLKISRAVFLPDLPVSTGFGGLKSPNPSENPRQNLSLPPILPNLGSFGLILPILIKKNCISYLFS